MVVGLGALHLIFQKKLWAKDVFRPYSTACDDIFVTTLVRAGTHPPAARRP